MPPRPGAAPGMPFFAASYACRLSLSRRSCRGTAGTGPDVYLDQLRVLATTGDFVPETGFRDEGLPDHIQQAIRSIARLHAAHHQGATPLQRTFRKSTLLLTRPEFITLVTVGIGGWIAYNILAPVLSYPVLDPPPFNGIGMAFSLASFYIVILVYATQRRDDELAELREQLTLELALFSEQKAAKVIQLLEEFRRDIPLVPNRTDEQANAMAQPVDPERVFDVIKDTHTQLDRIAVPE